MATRAIPSKMLQLCRLDDIGDGDARGFAVEGPNLAQRIIVARRGARVHAYVNSCPHVPTRLDYTRGAFFDAEGRHLHCDGHGAMFRVEDGVCIAGPCLGERLTPAPVRVRDGVVYLDRTGVTLVDEINQVISDLY